MQCSLFPLQITPLVWRFTGSLLSQPCLSGSIPNPVVKISSCPGVPRHTHFRDIRLLNVGQGTSCKFAKTACTLFQKPMIEQGAADFSTCAFSTFSCASFYLVTILTAFAFVFPYLSQSIVDTHTSD
ncbi:unnamed protein product [Dicrocoelium dendriticum]|nr:unnamed protein product [Dicrocoelium dendriticum]